MDDVRYLTYDPEQIWLDMIAAYVTAGGDVLYPGDEKEIHLRGVQAVLVQAFAAIDHALRMRTLRYATGEYLEIIGEDAFCPKIKAAPAEAEIEVTFNAGGRLDAGAKVTADGAMYYSLAADATKSGRTRIICDEPGAAGNGLEEGAQMRPVRQDAGVQSITVTKGAAGGRNEEDEEQYRERIYATGGVSNTTGPSYQYERVAMGVSPDILGSRALNIGAGRVGVYVITRDGADAAALLVAVHDALTPRHERPLSDHVTVLEADVIPYTLNVLCEEMVGDNLKESFEAVAAEHTAWQDNTVGRVFNPDRLMAKLYQAGAVRVIWEDGSEFNGGAVDYALTPPHARCKGVITIRTAEAMGWVYGASAKLQEE